MHLVDEQERLISVSSTEAKAIGNERAMLQNYCSEVIDGVLFPRLTELLRYIEEIAHKRW